MIPIIQHQDVAATTSKYAKFGDNLLITSFFRTIQGEGPLAGHPAVFVRTAGCNFGKKDPYCAFCDTSFEFDNGKIYSPEKLLDAVINLNGYNSKDVLVITGGEPTLQHNIIKFMNIAAPFFKTIQIETNGTQASFFKVYAAGFLAKDIFPLVVVSPKANFATKTYSELSPQVIDCTHALKFVLEDDPSSPHYTVPCWAFSKELAHIPLYVSPMAVYKRAYEGEVSSIWDSSLIDQEATAKNYAYAAKYAMEHNCLLSLQTHLFTAIP